MNPAAPAATPAVVPGNQTTEFQITKYVMIVGGVLTAALAVCSQVQEFLPAGNKIAGYATLAASVITALLVVLKALGYTSSRTDVKVAAAQAAGATAAAQAQASAGANAGAGAEAAK